jgi:hypothetical protein
VNYGVLHVNFDILITHSFLFRIVDQMNVEIASKLGVQLGTDTNSRANSSGGGEMTKGIIKGRLLFVSVQYI